MASVEERKNAHAMIEQFLRMYKARKKAVTLRLNADVLAWFKRTDAATGPRSIGRRGE
jgi:uncharacterized protein (DUF4415 family)